MKKFNRRNIFKFGLGATSVSLIPTPKLFAQEEQDPHFFLQVFLNPGADSSYLFDGRPMAMTNENMVQNYSGAEPEIWEGSNGTKALAYNHMNPLKELKEYFSVINGVHMATSFEGHTQNLNYLLSGNPFGGDWFLPQLEAGVKNSPLQYLQIGSMFSQVKNLGGGIQLEPFSAASLTQAVKDAPSFATESVANNYIKSQIAKQSAGNGLFSKGTAAMGIGLDGSSTLQAALSELDFGEPQPPIFFPPIGGQNNNFEENLTMVLDFFKKGIAAGAMIVIDGNFDTHDSGSASQSPQTFATVVENIKKLIETLRTTQYSETKSFYDQTTFMVSSEFSRTMRQNGLPIDQTGTDHNPLGNSIILGGRGVNGGRIVGATDFDSVDSFNDPSGAHLQKDPMKLKLMGKPFDLETQQPLDVKPENYKGEDYISATNVANTVFRIFGANTEKMWRVRANGPVAPWLKSITDA